MDDRNSYTYLKVRRVTETLVVTIDNPPVNALHPDVTAELSALFKAVEDDMSVRSLVLTGRGKCFIAGGDIKLFQTLTRETAIKLASDVQKMQEALFRLRVPTIVAVNGAALGGGLELLMCADIVIAEEQATFALPEVSLGILPGAGGTRMLARLIPPGTAKRMLFTGDRMSAQDAERVHLVDQIAPKGESLREALDLAGRINRNAPVAVAKAKSSAIYGADHSMDDAHRREIELFGSLFDTEDRQEGLAAFVERRPPEFKGS